MLFLIDASTKKRFHGDVKKVGRWGLVKIKMNTPSAKKQSMKVRWMLRQNKKDDTIWEYTDNAHRFHIDRDVLLIDEWNAVEMTGEDEYSRIQLADIMQIQVIRGEEPKKRIREKVIATYSAHSCTMTRRAAR